MNNKSADQPVIPHPCSLISAFVIGFLLSIRTLLAGADPGFLERGFICIDACVCGGGGDLAMLILSNFSYISHENEIIWSH